MPDIKKIIESLNAHGVNSAKIEAIILGKDLIPEKKQAKAQFLCEVIRRMDELLLLEEKQEIMDYCACCKTGKRDENIKKFVKENLSNNLAEKIRNLSNVKYMGNPKLNEDGSISCGIYYKDDDKFRCACPNFNGMNITVSKTYCLCCAGHYRYHYQNALGVKLHTREVVSSPLSSYGEKPCQFIYDIVE